MPRLPDETSLGPRPAPRSRRGVSRYNPGQVESAAGQLADTVFNLAQGFQERQDRQNYAKAKSLFAQEQIAASHAFDTDTDYQTFESRYDERMQKARSDASALIGHSGLREQFMSDTDVDIQRGMFQIQGKALQREKEHGLSVLTTTLDANREAGLTTDDTEERAALLQANALAIDTAVENGYLDKLKGTQLKKKTAIDYAVAFVGMQDPARQVTLLSDKKNAVVKMIPADKKADMLRKAKVKAEQGNTLLRSSIADRHKDAVSAYINGLDFEAPTQNDYRRAYGKTKGDKLYRELTASQSLGNDIQYAATATPEEINTLINSRNPQKKATKAGFANDLKRFGMLQNAIGKLVKEREQNPAAFLQKYNPDIQAAFGEAQVGDNVDDYVQMVIAEKERLGIRSDKILPDNYADGIAAQVNRAEGEQAADMIESLAEQWGKHWPSVFNQLSKDLAPAALVIGSGVDRPTGELLARTMNVKTADLTAGLDKTDIRDINESLAEEMAEFQVTVALQGNSSTYSKVFDQAKRLAYAYLGQGSDVDDAVNRVFSALVDDKYDIVDTYRVPREFDADDVAAGIEPLLNQFDLSSFAAMSPKGTETDFIVERMRSALLRDGQWITNEDETGLVLTYNGTVLANDNNQRIEFTFEELIGAGIETTPGQEALLRMKGF